MMIIPTPSTMPPMNEAALKPDSLHDAGLTVVVSTCTLVSVADDDNDDDDVTAADVGSSDVVLVVQCDDVDDGNVVAVLRATHTYTHTYRFLPCCSMQGGLSDCVGVRLSVCPSQREL